MKYKEWLMKWLDNYVAPNYKPRTCDRYPVTLAVKVYEPNGTSQKYAKPLELVVPLRLAPDTDALEITLPVPESTTLTVIIIFEMTIFNAYKR